MMEDDGELLPEKGGKVQPSTQQMTLMTIKTPLHWLQVCYYDTMILW
jgi:hypothetical protein